MSADLMEWQLETLVREEPFLDHSFPLNQFNGVNVNLIETLTVRRAVANERDASNYLAALGQAGRRMEEAISEARRLTAKNMIPPRFIVQATITQMKQFIATPAADNPFVTTFDQRMAAASIPERTRMQLRADAARIVGNDVYPAWQKAIALLEPLISRATDDAGIWRLNDGSEAYAHFLRRFTTTNLTPDQIHEIGLREVARIEDEMNAILRRLGRTQGSLKERIAKLRADLAYPLTEEGRTRIMGDVDQMIRDAEKRSESLFDQRPKSPVIAQPFPRFREANAAANYNSPAQDGSRPGVFQIPLRPERMTKFSLRSLVYHETIPGHHFQIAFQVENKSRYARLGAIDGFFTCPSCSNARKTAPAITAPSRGATQNIHNCGIAHPPAIIAGPVLRAGFTETFVTGIPMRWINVRAKPIAIGANPAGARRSVAPRMMKTKKNVRMVSARKPAVSE